MRAMVFDRYGEPDVMNLRSPIFPLECAGSTLILRPGADPQLS